MLYNQYWKRERLGAVGPQCSIIWLATPQPINGHMMATSSDIAKYKVAFVL
jgi:hypothetical protein